MILYKTKDENDHSKGGGEMIDKERETHCDDGNTLRERKNIPRKGNKKRLPSILWHKSKQLIEILRI